MTHPNGEVLPPLSSSTSSDSPRTTHSSVQNGADEYGQLRTLLIGAELAQLSRLQDRVDHMLVRAEDVSRVLPEAILVRSQKKDKQLTTALVPTVEAAITTSVKRNPQPLVEAIAPVMGPAIRRAIAHALSEITQRINQTLEQSLSMRSLRWRIEAWRTGRPFAEIVLSRTLLFRVEQVFLIHKRTGVLLQHVASGGQSMQDADMVSSMLTAIQSFVQGSFGTKTGDSLDSFQVGELTIEVESGPEALLAAVIRGSSPRRLRRVFVDALENIHLELGHEFEMFKGDATPFVASRPYLEDCLQMQSDQDRTGKKKSSWVLRILLLGVSAALLWWGYLAFQEHYRWSTYIERLKEEPGIVVLATEKHGGKRFVTGLRDPLATDPLSFLLEAQLDPTQVMSHWEPYQALQPQFVLERAKAILAPPDGLQLQFADGILSASGVAPREWINDAQKIARAVPGVMKFDDSALMDVGAEAQQLQLKELMTAKTQLEHQTVRFSPDTLDFAPGQDEQLKQAAGTLRVLFAAAQFVKQRVQVDVIGHADETGAPLGDQVLSLTRGERVIAELMRNGLTQGDLAMVRARAEEIPPAEKTSGSQSLAGRVSFRVNLLGKS
ncbi:MAG: OmpA family protein [Candidatus Binatia bacterium]